MQIWVIVSTTNDSLLQVAARLVEDVLLGGAAAKGGCIKDTQFDRLLPR